MTDSASSLPADIATAYGVTVVPMWVTIGDQQFRDGELGMAEVLGRLGEGLSTSGPAPGELAQAATAADHGEGVIILTLSKNMSGVYQAARVATGLLEADAGEKVAVVDTGTAAGAEGLVVLAAATAARDGSALATVVAVAEDVRSRVRLVATLPSLEYLARGGRVPGAAAWGRAGSASTPSSSSGTEKSGRFGRRAAVGSPASGSSRYGHAKPPGNKNGAPRCTSPRSTPSNPMSLNSSWARSSAGPAGDLVRGLVQPRHGRPHRPRPGRVGVVVGRASRG